MRAAIYARKSTDQSGVAEEQRSVARQIEAARAFASQKGWTVLDDCIFADDGISGAEFANRPGFVSMMQALRPSPPFDVLIMSEESRLGREQIEVGFALKQVVRSGVRVFCYLSGREVTLGSSIEKAMLALQSMADEMERERARQRTYDAMQRKARAGHATGGRTFGYHNFEVRDSSGKRSHVVQEINPPEAEVVRRIFRLCAEEHGQTAIAKRLNEQGALSPRAQQGRPSGWTSSSVREVLRREKYKGVLVWNQSRKRDAWGQRRQTDLPPDQWFHLDAPQLMIVTPGEWDAAHARITEDRRRYGGGGPGRSPGHGAKYLLTGLLRCDCGAGIEAHTRSHGKERAVFYGCSAYRRKGARVCSNSLCIPAEEFETAIIREVVETALRPAVVREVIAQVAAMADSPDGEQPERLEREIEAINAQLRRLTDALAAGDAPVATVLQGIREREEQKSQFERRLKFAHAAASQPQQWKTEVPRSVEEWRVILRDRDDAEEARRVLRLLLPQRLECTPRRTAQGDYYEFRGEGTLRGAFPPHILASPTGLPSLYLEGPLASAA